MTLTFHELIVGGQDSMILQRDIHVLEPLRNTLKPCDNLRAATARMMRNYYEGSGIPMPDDVEKRPLWWGGVVYLFPNYFIMPTYGDALAYRSRPFNDDPRNGVALSSGR